MFVILGSSSSGTRVVIQECFIECLKTDQRSFEVTGGDATSLALWLFSDNQEMVLPCRELVKD